MVSANQQTAETLAPLRSNLFMHAVLEHIIDTPFDGVSELEWLGYSLRMRNPDGAMQVFKMRGLAPYGYVEGADGGGFILCRPTPEVLFRLRTERAEAGFEYVVDMKAVH